VIVNAPTLAQGGPARILVLNQWVKIGIQVTGPDTVFVGTTKDEAGLTNNGAAPDGFQFNNVNANIPFFMWWKGELWISGNNTGAFAIILVPGQTTKNYEAGGANCPSDEQTDPID
jgi:hypothetical protein